ncbi:MAG: hypothetical protein ACRDCW_02035 [Sarcina sp.]
MPIQSNDFSMSLSFSGLSGSIESVIGVPATISLLFSNNSSTDSLYNLSFDLTLPDGVSFVNSSLTPTSNSINSSFENIISFKNIKDLYSNELNYKIDLSIQIDEYLRSDAMIPVDFMTVFSNISFSASADTKPRGNLDIGNQTIFATTTATATAYRYSITFIGPTTFLKGAGSDLSSSANQIFNPIIQITNNTRESSTVNFHLDLANGIRYLNNFSVSGIDESNFSSPTVIYPSSSQNFTSLNISNINLSANSINEISFSAAIWNNLTLNGIENSGSEIQNGTLLESQAYLEYQGVYQYSYFSLKALILIFFKTLLSTNTDWNKINQFQITYNVSPYLGVDNFYLTNLIPDGLTFVESTPNVTSLNDNGDGTTSIIWDVGTLTSNTSGIINFSLQTNETYSDGSNIVSTDAFESILTGVFTNPNSEITSTDSITKTLSVAAPTITKSTIQYYDSNLIEKNFNVATVGDFIEFKIIYDALNIDAIQKNVYLYDYPPLNMFMSTLPSYTTSGDFPSSATIELVSDNGIMISLGELMGGTYFEINFKIEVTTEQTSKLDNNLAKISLTDKFGFSTSIRDLSTIVFGVPNLTYSSISTKPECIVLNDSLIYKLTIKNQSTNTLSNITTAFNINSQTLIPNKFAINTIIITSTGTSIYQTPTSINNLVNFIIDSLSPESTITLQLNLTVSSLPLFGETFTIQNTLTRGTSQSEINSYDYNGLNITKNENITACIPIIEKNFITPTSAAGQILTTNILITIPKGLLGYNLEIFDKQLTTNISNFDNLMINNVAISSSDFSFENQNLKLPLIQSIDSSLSQITYQISYTDIVYDITPINNETTFNTTTILNWTPSISSSTIYSINTSDQLTLLSPELKIDKYQKNHTKNTLFSKNSITGELGDIILYKIKIENIGKSTAYNIKFTDILDSNLTFINLLVGNGIFNLATNTLTINTISLLAGYYIEFLIETQIKSIPQTELALNIASANYYLSNSQTNVYLTAFSDTIKIFEDLFLLKKEQRNVTLNTAFVTDGLTIIKDQIFQYKITLTNFNKDILTNISITDTFSSEIQFLNFEPFNNGTLSIIGNTITANIDNLSLNESISFTYNLKLNIDTLQKKASFATISFSTPLDTENFILPSNIIYTTFSALGRGFFIY